MAIVVNDVQSRLNETEVAEVLPVDSLASLQRAVERSRPLALAGGRHSMGGQQFLKAATLVDTRPMNAVLDFDAESGLVKVEAGIEWPDLISSLIELQRDDSPQWGIRQKQTGADAFTVGGS